MATEVMPYGTFNYKMSHDQDSSGNASSKLEGQGMCKESDKLTMYDARKLHTDSMCQEAAGGVFEFFRTSEEGHAA